jgi:hypothetical protein
MLTQPTYDFALLAPIAALCASISRGLAPYYADLLNEEVPGEMLAMAFRLREGARFSPPARDPVTRLLEPDVAERLIRAERRGLLSGLTWANPQRP